MAPAFLSQENTRVRVSNRFLGGLIMALGSIFGPAACDTAHAAGKAELPKPELELASDKQAKPGETRTAIFAGGCFWCVEGVFEQLDGVKEAVSGYAGGTKQTADYETVCTGRTAHAEAVRVVYDPSKITYAQLLQVFFTTHDPTTKNRQGNDVGPQYRSAIFYLNDEQKKVAEAYVAQVDKAKVLPKPIVTTLEPLKPDAFYVAEDYHQNYVACNMGNPYVRAVALPKVYKTREAFKDQLKKDQPAQSQQK
jgi:peptide-methionine (S)-S-oxide reductase